MDINTLLQTSSEKSSAAVTTTVFNTSLPPVDPLFLTGKFWVSDSPASDSPASDPAPTGVR